MYDYITKGLDLYKLTMLQFIWKHYSDVEVRFDLFSRSGTVGYALRYYETYHHFHQLTGMGFSEREIEYLDSLGIFSKDFLGWLRDYELPAPTVYADRLHVEGKWGEVTLWETLIMSVITENLSNTKNSVFPYRKVVENLEDARAANFAYADFGTRRRFSFDTHQWVVDSARRFGGNFVGTSNVFLAMDMDLKPVGTYAHELQMVLNAVLEDQFDATDAVLTKWSQMYPKMKVALTDTFTTKWFLEEFGQRMSEEGWKLRLDSGDPRVIGDYIEDWYLDSRLEAPQMLFSDSLNPALMAELNSRYYHNNPTFGWGTNLTNPDSSLSIVVKPTLANGRRTYKVTDDPEKSVGPVG